jgi:hypothetical protein
MDPDKKLAVVPFTPEVLPALRAFSERYWKRPRTDAYYEWRYLAPRPFSRMFVALRGEECVGTLFALRKTWRLRGQPVPCLEVFDWHALPECRAAGAGIRLMRAMMRQPERVLSIGGTADVYSTLPLMGWQPFGTANAFELPLSAALLAGRLQRARGVPLPLARAAMEVLAGPMFRPRRRTVPVGGAVQVADAPSEEIRSLYEGDTGYDFVQEPDLEILRWLTASRWSGSWRYLHFRVGGRLRGWAMTRTYLGRHGRQGSLVEVFAPRPDRALYEWMVSEVAVSLLADRPRRLLARALCPILQEALAANRFRHAGVDSPLHTWPKFGDALPARSHFTFLHSDGPILPYETEHASAEEPA